MANVYLGLFKTLFPVETATPYLVGQVTTGTTYFDYYKLGTNSTKYASANNLMGYDSGSNDAPAVKSLVWVDATNNRFVTTLYDWGRIQDQPTTASPSTTIEIDSVAPVVLVNDIYVARLPIAPAISNYGVSPAHIKNISGTDYLVCYTLSYVSTNVFKVNRYTAELDLEIDQSTIPKMTLDDSITYTYSSGSYEIHVAGINSIPQPLNHTNSGSYKSMLGAQLVTNASGNKTIFGIGRRPIGGSYDTVIIFELTDDGTTMSLSEEYTYTPRTYYTNETPGNDVSRYKSGTRTQTRNYFNTLTCPNYSQDSTSTYSGVITSHLEGNDPDYTIPYYLGCAYDRMTDQPIICIGMIGSTPGYHSDTITYEQISGDHLDDVSDHTTTAQTTGGLSSDGFTILIRDITDDSDTVLCSSEANFTLNTEWTINLDNNTLDVTGTSTSDYGDTVDFGIVDLSCRIFIFKETRYVRSATYNDQEYYSYSHQFYLPKYSQPPATETKQKETAYYVSANNVKTKINSTGLVTTTDAIEYMESYSRWSGSLYSTRIDSVSSSTVCDPDLTLGCQEWQTEEKECITTFDHNYTWT